MKPLELQAYKMARDQARQKVYTPPELRAIEEKINGKPEQSCDKCCYWFFAGEPDVDYFCEHEDGFDFCFDHWYDGSKCPGFKEKKDVNKTSDSC